RFGLPGEASQHRAAARCAALVAPPMTGGVAMEAQGMRAREPVNILLVDDQPGKLLSYEAILAPLGENLIQASSGKEALEHLLRTDIAVVLIDVCMPDLDGFELATMIRE